MRINLMIIMKKNNNNSNNNKINIPEFNVKRYKMNYKYRSIINKWGDDKNN